MREEEVNERLLALESAISRLDKDVSLLEAEMKIRRETTEKTLAAIERKIEEMFTKQSEQTSILTKATGALLAIQFVLGILVPILIKVLL